MSIPRGSSLPSQIPILPLIDQDVLFPGLFLHLRITSPAAIAFLSHIPRLDQATWVNLVLGCVPVRTGHGIGDIIGENGLALPAPEEPPKGVKQVTSPPADFEFGCTARIKSLIRLDHSYGATGFVLMVEGRTRPHNVLIYRDLSLPNRQGY